MKKPNQADSITQKESRGKLTPEQKEFLVDMHISRIFNPSVQQFIDVFDLPITRQSIQVAAEAKLKKYGK